MAGLNLAGLVLKVDDVSKLTSRIKWLGDQARASGGFLAEPLTKGASPQCTDGGFQQGIITNHSISFMYKNHWPRAVPCFLFATRSSKTERMLEESIRGRESMNLQDFCMIIGYFGSQNRVSAACLFHEP